MQVELGAPSVWLLLAVIGAGIFAIRLSFIQLRGVIDKFPPQVERSLKFVPAAIFSAIVFPELFVVDGSIGGLDSLIAVVINARSVAGGIAAVVAIRTGSILATVGIGMAVLWGIRAIVG